MDKYSKFFLFTDSQIGLGDIEDCASSQAVIQADQDEDYLTDAAVMKSTIRLCKRDLVELDQILSQNKSQIERSCHNIRYQDKFGVRARKDTP